MISIGARATRDSRMLRKPGGEGDSLSATR